MRNIITLLSLLIFSVTASSQYIKKKPLSELNVEYIEIEVVGIMLSNTILIEVDYGQKNKLFEVDDRITDQNGFSLEFNSTIDALNFMSNYGYELHSIVPIVDVAHPIRRYILKKKKP